MEKPRHRVKEKPRKWRTPLFEAFPKKGWNSTVETTVNCILVISDAAVKWMNGEMLVSAPANIPIRSSATWKGKERASEAEFAAMEVLHVQYATRHIPATTRAYTIAIPTKIRPDNGAALESGSSASARTRGGVITSVSPTSDPTAETRPEPVAARKMGHTAGESSTPTLSTTEPIAAPSGEVSRITSEHTLASTPKKSA